MNVPGQKGIRPRAPRKKKATEEDEDEEVKEEAKEVSRMGSIKCTQHAP